MWTLLLLALIIFRSTKTLSNPTTRQPVVLDYKRLCLEKLLPSMCVYNSATLSNVTKDSLAATVDPFDVSNNTVIIVEISTFQRTSEFQKDLDIFLVSRPQWIVREHLVHHYHDDVGLKSIVLQHLPQELAPSYSYIAKVNFPIEKSSCSDRPFCVEFIDGTWGNGFINMAGNYGWCSRAVFVPFTSRTGNGNDRVFLADEFACPQTVNKWECLFLPSTTCTWPDVITNCHDRECLPKDSKVHFSSASGSGVPILREAMQTAMQRHPSPVNTYRIAEALMVYSTDKENNTITSQTVQWEKIGTPDVHSLFALYGVFTRFNSVFGGLVQEAIHDFRATRTPVATGFRPDVTCVAVHVRRDDRALPGEDMLAWCKNHTTVNSNGQKSFSGLWIDGLPLSFGQWADMGCGAQLPYGAATLEHFLNASRVLMPQNRNVFMLTDDPKWLKGEIKKYYASNRRAHSSHSNRNSTIMNIFTPSIRPNHRGGTFNSSIDFWASITLARQCQAVVGHRGSAAFEFIYKNLCFFHDNKFLQCPPMFSIGGP